MTIVLVKDFGVVVFIWVASPLTKTGELLEDIVREGRTESLGLRSSDSGSSNSSNSDLEGVLIRGRFFEAIGGDLTET